MNKLLKTLTDLAEQHNLSITNLSIQEIGNKTVTNVEFEKDNRPIYKDNGVADED